MNIFKTVTFKWWQGSMFKISMIAGGIAIGAYWSDFFINYLMVLVVIAVVLGLYVSYVWWNE